jgi:mono/diheme cytochrome c family protein
MGFRHRVTAAVAAMLLGNLANAQPVRETDGSTLFRAYCAVCHGADAKGGGPMAKYLKDTPTNLTTLTLRNAGKFPMTRVQKIISGEEEIQSGHGTTAMPVWGPVFSNVAWDRDLGKIRIYNLAKYIAGLQK